MARKKTSPQKFQKLVERANNYYSQSMVSYTNANEKWKQGLEDAAKCGEALLEIKRNLSWGRFKIWANNKFIGRSYNTASDYMRVANAFIKKDTRLEEAIKSGKEINSINAVKEILRKPRIKEKNMEQDDDGKSIALTETDRASCIRQFMREMFAPALRNCCIEELQVCEDEDVFDKCWKSFYNTLYKIACQKYEFDVNEYLLEMGKLEQNQPVLKSRSDFAREGARMAKEDMRFPNKRQRREAAQKTIATKKLIRFKLLLAMNKSRMTEQRKKEIRHQLEVCRKVV